MAQAGRSAVWLYAFMTLVTKHVNVFYVEFGCLLNAFCVLKVGSDVFILISFTGAFCRNYDQSPNP